MSSKINEAAAFNQFRAQLEEANAANLALSIQRQLVEANYRELQEQYDKLAEMIRTLPQNDSAIVGEQWHTIAGIMLLKSGQKEVVIKEEDLDLLADGKTYVTMLEREDGLHITTMTLDEINAVAAAHEKTEAVVESSAEVQVH